MSWRETILAVFSNVITCMATLTVPESDERRLRNAIADLRTLEKEFESVGVVDHVTGSSEHLPMSSDVKEHLLSMATAISSRRLFGDDNFVIITDELTPDTSGLFIPITAAEPGRAIMRVTEFAGTLDDRGQTPRVFQHRCEHCSAQATSLLAHQGYGPVRIVGHSSAECLRNPLLSKRTGEALLDICAMQNVIDLRPIILDAKLLEEEQ